jgi:hypothetical protein
MVIKINLTKEEVKLFEEYIVNLRPLSMWRKKRYLQKYIKNLLIRYATKADKKAEFKEIKYDKIHIQNDLFAEKFKRIDLIKTEFQNSNYQKAVELLAATANESNSLDEWKKCYNYIIRIKKIK